VPPRHGRTPNGWGGLLSGRRLRAAAQRLWLPGLSQVVPFLAGVAVGAVALAHHTGKVPASSEGGDALRCPVRETRLCASGERSTCLRVATSPTAWRAAIVKHCFGGCCVVVNGKAGRVWQWVGSPIFSGDGAHVAYAARQGGTWRVVVDEQPGPPFDRVSRPRFSADSRHLLYIGERGGECLPVRDGVAGPRFAGSLFSELTLSPDGTRTGYVVSYGGNQSAIIDGRRGPACDDILTDSIRFSGDSRHVAYCAQRGRECAVVLDGVSGPPHEDVGPVVFSRDSRHMAFSARDGGSESLVVDGQSRWAYAHLSGYGFLGTSARPVFEARLRPGAISPWCVVVAGQPDPPHEYVTNLSVSADGTHVAYAVGCGDSERIVLDGVPGPAYDTVHGLTFSPDGRRFAHTASDDRGTWVVLDGIGSPRHFSSVRCLTFSEDGLHFVYAARRRGRPAESESVVLDGVPGPDYDLTHTPFRFRTHGPLVYVAQKAGALWRVEQTLPAGRRERAYRRG